MGYIFAMQVCRGRVLPQVLWTLAFATALLRADPGDVENSRDYAGFPRPQGFVITDYDEDNPAESDFPVARPLPIDSNHVEMVHVQGHRFVIRYELASGSRPLSLFQTQRYYEKLAAEAGFAVEKSGAVGDVTETFRRTTASREVWVYLEPAVTVNVLTVMESTVSAPPSLGAAATAPAVVSAPAPQPPPVDPNDDSLYASLNRQGRVVLPFVFQPGKDDLDASSQPLIDRIAAMMKRHPDLVLRIEGHTDNTGDPDDNLRLSAERAIAVQTLLIAADIDPKRLDAVGVGGLQPLADNHTAEGREKNRRIELVMWKQNPAFHATAPNGHNYYPDSGASSASAKTGL
ncbi:MAG: OmpA family protein [Methylacidiphilales bacterium]|nr:OmpA family protein [Candidatus Methylacidiphilales bacterium]